jgi:hypothetical protein
MVMIEYLPVRPSEEKREEMVHDGEQETDSCMQPTMTTLTMTSPQ